MNVFFRDRSFGKIADLPGVEFEPLYYRTEAQGGHSYALIQATGTEQDLYRLLEWLRYETTISDENGTPRWWGYVNRASFERDGRAEGLILHAPGPEGTKNRVAVIWSDGVNGGTTAWAEDADSMLTFGTIELLYSKSGVNEATAEQVRDSILEELKEPAKQHTLGRKGQQTAILLECKGQFDALDFTHHDRDEGLEEHVPTGGVAQKVGWGFTSSEVGFTSKNRSVSQLFHRMNTLEKGDKVKITGSASNNNALTIESTNDRERISYTASTIAFLQEVKRAGPERLRASVAASAPNKVRVLDNYNLHGATTAITTLNGAVAATATTITVNTVEGLTSRDRIRIALAAGGYHTTFISGNPDSTANTVNLEDEMPGNANDGAAVDRINRWVTNEAGDVYYTESTDYTIDATNGTITFVNTASGGTLTNNQVIYVTYLYTEYRVEDTELGLGFVGTGDIVQVSGSGGGTNDDYYRVLTTSSEGDRFTVRESVADEGPGNTITIARGSNAVVEESLTDELPGSSVTVSAYGTAVAQSFQISSDEAWTVNQVEVRASKVGTPVDNLRVQIWSDSGGLPNAVIEYVDIAPADISTQLGWLTAQFDNATTSLAVGTTYWLVVGRSGAVDSFNYYEVSVDEDLGYTSGALKVKDGTDWQDRPTNADLIFRILGSEVTTTQIQKIVDQEGQFLEGHDIVDASGISTNQYRPGRQTALTELEDLLEIGTTNGRRLLATVTIDRILHVEEEPDEPDEADYIYHNEKKITDKLGRDIPKGSLEFVRKWMSPVDDFGIVGASWWARQGKFFVESAEYVVETEEWEVVPRGANNPWEIGRVPNA